jgi:hypothetical protein
MHLQRQDLRHPGVHLAKSFLFQLIRFFFWFPLSLVLVTISSYVLSRIYSTFGVHLLEVPMRTGFTAPGGAPVFLLCTTSLFRNFFMLCYGRIYSTCRVHLQTHPEGQDLQHLGGAPVGANTSLSSFLFPCK